MGKLASQLEDITPLFFALWREWRHGQGWRLGPDLPGALLSPHMVDDWDQLTDTSRNWFRQHAALVIAAAEQVKSKTSKEDPIISTTVRDPAIRPDTQTLRQSALVRMVDAFDAAKMGDNLTAIKLCRLARGYMKRNPEDIKVVNQIDRAINTIKKINAGRLPAHNSVDMVGRALAAVRSA